MFFPASKARVRDFDTHPGRVFYKITHQVIT
jgi:hypothetical protein